MGDEITRQEYTVGMNRVHDRVDKIADTAVRVEVSAQKIEESVRDMHRVMFGDGRRTGVIAKLATLCSKVNLQWFFIAGIILGLFGTAFYVVKSNLGPMLQITIPSDGK